MKIKPDYAEAHYNLGVVFGKQGKLALAAAQYERALKIKPDYAKAHYKLGLIFAKQGNLVQAAAQYKRTVQIDPAHVDAHFNLAIHLTNARSYTEALKHFRKVLELRPDHAWARHDRSMVALANNLAWILATHTDAKIRNGAEAIRHAKAVVAATGGDEPSCLDTLAAAYAEAGKFSEAVKTAQRALAAATAKKQVDLAEQIESRLKIYQRGEPYRSE